MKNINKKIIGFWITLISLITPTIVLATVTPTTLLRDSSGFVRPSLIGDYLLSSYFTATSTTATSTFAGPVSAPLNLTETINYKNNSGTDFTFVLLPDTQNEVADAPLEFLQQMQWISDNKTALNIQAVIGLGDIVDDSTDATQWTNADAGYDIIDAMNVPYIPLVGNHDYNNVSTKLTTTYNTYFGPSRFTGKSWYGDTSYPSGKNENMYIKFDVGTRKFLVLGLEFYPRQSAVDWGQSVIDANQDREVILVTHSYLDNDGLRVTEAHPDGPTLGYGYTDAYSGEELWYSFVSINPQIKLVANGHNICAPHAAHNTDISTTTGKMVYELFQNYQCDTDGGEGYTTILTFNSETSTIGVSYYSINLAQYDPLNPSFTLGDFPIAVNNGLGVKGGLTIGDNLKIRGHVVLGNHPVASSSQFIIHPDPDSTVDSFVVMGNTSDENNFVIKNDGRVGIATTSPTGLFTIENQGAKPSLFIADSLSPDASPTIFTATGIVGFGTTTPMNKLSVKGPINIANSSGDTYWASISEESSDLAISLFGTNTQFGLNITGTNRLQITTTGRTGISSSTPSGKLAVTGLGTTNSTRTFVLANSSNVEWLTGLDSGQLGIGTTTPYVSLGVNGSGVFNDNVRASYFTATSTTQASTFPYASSTMFTTSGGAQFATAGGGAVGVGTTTPLGTFNIAGNTMQLYLTDLDTTSTKNWLVRNANGDLTFATSTDGGTAAQDPALFVKGGLTASSGFVGIGTASPSTLLHVQRTGITETLVNSLVSGYTSSALRGFGSGTTVTSPTQASGVLEFREKAGTDGYFSTIVGQDSAGTVLSGLSLVNDSVASDSGSLHFFTRNVGTIGEKAVITSAGNFGIATTSPYALLSVAGQVVGAYFTATTTTASVFPLANITKLSNLTSNGFVKTSGSDGTLSVDTNTYLTGNQTITLSGDITGSGSTAITTAYNGTVPLNKGGTNATSFTTSGNSVYYNGTSLATANTTTGVTTPFASSTMITTSGGAQFATAGGGAVGIGTTSPLGTFQVAANTVQFYLTDLDTAGTKNWLLRNANGSFTIATSTDAGTAAQTPVVTIIGGTGTNSGYFGIGGSPSSPFHIQRQGITEALAEALVSGYASFAFRGYGSGTTITSGSQAGAVLEFRDKSGTDNYFSAIVGQDSAGTTLSGISLVNDSVASDSGSLHFFTRNTGTIGEKAVIKPDGDFGIGTSTPTIKLHVNETSATTTIAVTVISGATRSTTLGGKIILQDMAGGTCTEITTQSGVISSRAVTCP